MVELRRVSVNVAVGTSAPTKKAANGEDGSAQHGQSVLVDEFMSDTLRGCKTS